VQVTRVRVGLVCAAIAARTLASQLFAITPRDAPSYGVAVVAIAVAAVAACRLPARRATAINPLEALRSE